MKVSYKCKKMQKDERMCKKMKRKYGKPML